MLAHHAMIILLASVVFSSGTAVAAGAIYKWVDQNGITQYSQTPPPKNARSSQTVRVSTHVPVDVREGRAQGMVDAQTLQAYTAPPQGQGSAVLPPTVGQIAANNAAATNGQTNNTAATNGQTNNSADNPTDSSPEALAETPR